MAFGGSTRRYGALTVVEQPRSREDIQQRLRQLDPKLFVELQRRQADVDEYGRPIDSWAEGRGQHAYYDVWTVCLETEAGIVPLYEWREPEGAPIPYLSEGLVSEMQRRYQRGPVDFAAIVEQNRQRKQQAHDDLMRDVSDLVDDHYPWANPLRSSPLQRGKHLQAGRRRQREKVRQGKAPPVEP